MRHCYPNCEATVRSLTVTGGELLVGEVVVTPWHFQRVPTARETAPPPKVAGTWCWKLWGWYAQWCWELSRYVCWPWTASATGHSSYLNYTANYLGKKFRWVDVSPVLWPPSGQELGFFHLCIISPYNGNLHIGDCPPKLWQTKIKNASIFLVQIPLQKFPRFSM